MAEWIMYLLITICSVSIIGGIYLYGKLMFIKLGSTSFILPIDVIKEIIKITEGGSLHEMDEIPKVK